MLILTLFLMRKKISIRRVLMAAVLGAVTSTLMLVVGLHFGLLYILILLGMGSAMMSIAMKQKSRNDILLGIVYYFTLVFVFSKLLKGGEWITKNQLNGMVVAIIVIGVMSIALLYIILMCVPSATTSALPWAAEPPCALCAAVWLRAIRCPTRSRWSRFCPPKTPPL